MSRHELLLAYGIAEYDTSLSHLHALDRAGVHVPFAVFNRLQIEQRMLVQRWLVEHGDPFIRHDTVEVVTREARTFLAEHQDDLDALLQEEGITA